MQRDAWTADLQNNPAEQERPLFRINRERTGAYLLGPEWSETCPLVLPFQASCLGTFAPSLNLSHQRGGNRYSPLLHPAPLEGPPNE